MWTRKSSFSSSLDIQLLEPVVFVGSNLDTSPVIRGTIQVDLSKSCTIQNLNLDVQGTLKTLWYEDTKSKSDSQIIVQHQLPLYPTSELSAPLLLNAGSTSFSFEMPLPYGIPESIQSPQINVDYEITAQMDFKRTDNPAHLHKETKKQLILARLPDSGMLAGENSPITIDSHKHFSNWCQYRISLDTKSATIGSCLPIKFEIAPTTTGFKLKKILVQVLEKRILNEKKYQSVHFLHPIKHVTLPSSDLLKPWESSFVYQIPDDVSHSTDNYKYYHIDHILLVSLIVTVPDPKNHKKSLNKTISFQTHIDLLDSHLSNLVNPDLPPYDCPVSKEEKEKLNRHGLASIDQPPTYQDAIVYTPPVYLSC